MAVLSHSGELVCSDLSLECEMVRKLNKKAPKKKSRRSFTGYLHGRESDDEEHMEINGIRRNSFLLTKVYSTLIFLTMLY